ncbi:hypothetical protein CLNEO_13640 [Anaerotignum neopropionicum]|uniref:DUF4365 domain-containing protein n=1 Tax=Anaerotignum neopropionicum TaxID=36847 RepID=A0A136WG62_9FIRM|nr:hypothetical protein [Anaerotignum neopropionicum]KXL53393.1 hypothetical protein CLNEO_13640 [Anaerotignum neopropionicum]
MSTNYKNAKHNLEGKVGEDKVLEYLKTIPKMVKITDVREMDEYQGKDVDFICKKQIDEWDCKKYSIEVKTDIAAGTYGNFFIEKQIHYLVDTPVAKKGTITQGWIYYSECDFFFIFVPKQERIYIFHNNVIKQYINKFHPPVRNCNDGYKIVHGWCVKIKDFLQKYNESIVCIDSNTFKQIDNRDVINNL